MAYCIAVDAMGGDNAPGAVVEGVKKALSTWEDLEIHLFGQKELLGGLEDIARLTVLDAREVISMHESPTLAVRKKKDSSMVRAMLEVKEGTAQAMVSAGSTGAVMMGSVLRVGRIPGIDRPALPVVIPGRKKPFLLLDCGANVDCQPDFLNQFGLMGSVYMEKVMGVASPEVRLANIGAEEEKGNKLTKEAFGIMQAQKVYQFCGNVEARDIPMGVCDVVVADGFDGNLLLKYTEGLTSAMFGMIKDAMMSGVRSKIGALLLKPALTGLKSKLSASAYGGAPMLGVKGVVIKAHGSSDAEAFCNAIGQARTMLVNRVTETIEDALAQMAKKSDTDETDAVTPKETDSASTEA